MKLQRFPRKLFITAAVFFVLLDSFLFVIFLHTKSNAKIRGDVAIYTYPEAEALRASVMSFRDLSQYFTDLAGKKGAPYAYEVLKAAPIPLNIDMHLLGHVVGDILYKQQGLEGIKACTEDFRNACSHSVVIGLFFEKSEAALPEIAEACRRAPGGSGAYTMCFHGLGHGILAYVGYDLPKAIELCEKTGTEAYRNREYVECVGGTVMEIIGGGFHNQKLWAEQSKKYTKVDDPLYLCSSDFMPDVARSQCYVYLTPHLFQMAGGNLANPTPTDFKKAFRFCDHIPRTQQENRSACYGGFGKEFIVLAKDRDIRKLEQMTSGELMKVYDWCLLGEEEKRVGPCIEHSVNSLYWGGENNRGASIRFCSLIPDAGYANICFTNLLGSVSYYIQDSAYRKEFCNEVPPLYRPQCSQTLLKE